MIEVIMPKLSLTMEFGTIMGWFKEEGDEVVEGEPLLEIETDKVVSEIGSPASGTLGKIIATKGDIVPIVQVICYILAPGEEMPKAWPPSGENVDILPKETDVISQASRSNAVVETSERQTGLEGKIRSSPSARRLADENKIELAKVDGTGPMGRIESRDVIRFINDSYEVDEEIITPTQVQCVTAERMSKSFTSVPHIYLTVEVIAEGLNYIRDKLLPTIKASKDLHITFTDLFTMMVSKVLKKHPLVNASWENGKIRIYKRINIGLATTIKQGLVVPVIKDANHKDLFQISRERTQLTEKATRGQLKLEDLEGGTFTITNLGMFGVDEFNAIINIPQSAILAIGQIKDRAVVEGGQVSAKPTLRLTLSLDHRVLDGAVGAKFLSDLKALIERPEGIFEEVV